MATTQIVEFDDSAALILPPELLEGLQLTVGDTVYLTETPEGCRLTTNVPNLVGDEAGNGAPPR
ncbi:hypothetical protein [Viridibacterium curvum]